MTRVRLIVHFCCALAMINSLSGMRFLLFHPSVFQSEDEAMLVNKRYITSSTSVDAPRSAAYYESADIADNTVWTENLQHGVVARAFNWSQSLPCFPPDEAIKQFDGFRQPATNGFLYMKLVKTGGSTATGVAMRIAKHTAERNKEKFWICRGRWDHSFAFKMLQDRRRHDSFTWTILREPTKRAVSEFFHFQVSREGTSPSDESFQNYLEGRTANDQRNLYLNMLSIEKVQVFDSSAPTVINTILSDYDFIGITERMDESLVALMMLLNIRIGDILHLDAKGNGNYDDGAYKNTCYFIQPSKVSPTMRRFFESSYWTEAMQWDNLFYQAANRSLDLTIDRLGRDAFNENLATFHHANQVAKERCLLSQEIFPCTSTGQRNKNASCLWGDSGCGDKCLDQVAGDLGLS